MRSCAWQTPSRIRARKTNHGDCITRFFLTMRKNKNPAIPDSYLFISCKNVVATHVCVCEWGSISLLMITEMVPLFYLKKEERRRIMYRNRWDLTTNFTCITPVRASNFFHFLKLHVCLIRRVQTARNCATVCVNAITVHGQRYGHNNHNGTRSELGLPPFLAPTILHMCCSYGFLFSSSSPESPVQQERESTREEEEKEE